MTFQRYTEPQRVRRITSHVGLSRFLDSVVLTELVIPRMADIPSPYAFSPTHVVYHDVEMQRYIFVVETAHKRYDVFEVPSWIEMKQDVQS